MLLGGTAGVISMCHNFLPSALSVILYSKCILRGRQKENNSNPIKQLLGDLYSLQRRCGDIHFSNSQMSHMAPNAKKAIKPLLSFEPVFESHGITSIGSLVSEEINYFLNSH